MGDCLKRGAWTVCRFKWGGGGCFLTGGYTPMHTMTKFYDLKCEKPFEDQVKSYLYVFYFQHRLKSKDQRKKENWLCMNGKTMTLDILEAIYIVDKKIRTIFFP